MATKKIKWFQKDGSLLHPETEWSMIVGAPEYPDVSNYLPLTGGTLTGNLKVGSATIQTNGYITGTWLQTTSTGTHLSSSATKVAVLDGSGWVYHRTPSELLGDMGGASTSYVDTKVANIVNSAPETLDTLNELAKALGNDPNFATTVATQIGGKVSKAGDTMTGTLVIPNLDNIKISAAAATKNASPTWVATFKNNSAQDGLAASTVEQVLPQRLREYQGSGTGNHAVDDLYKTGFYYIDKDNTKNRPPFYQGTVTGNDYKVLVTGYSNQWAQQIATDFRSNDVFVRRLESGGWQGWTALVKMQQGLGSGALRPPTNTIAVFDNNVNATIKSSNVLLSDLAKKTDITWANIPDKPTIVSTENFVTIDTRQNITGAKSFQTGITTIGEDVPFTAEYRYDMIQYEDEQGGATLSFPRSVRGGGTIALDEDITWEHLFGKPSWITDTKPTYSWSEITNRPTIPDVSNYVAKSGDTMTGTLTVPDVYTKHQFIIPATNADGRGSGIYETKDATNLFGFLSGDTNHATLNVGATGKNLSFRGKATRPTYNGTTLALSTDIKTYTALDNYPVGIIVAFYNATKPATAFGGSWQHMGATFLYGASSETASAGGTGGAATHKLTTAQMPRHTHSVSLYIKGLTPTVSGGACITGIQPYVANGSYGAVSNAGSATANGSGTEFSILPPYTVVHYWRRTA